MSSLQETLARLSAKPGVTATLVLSRKDGAVIQSSGLESADNTRPPETNRPGSSDATADRGQPRPSTGSGADDAANSAPSTSNSQHRTAEDIARAVFSYVSDTARFVNAMSDEDDVQLLRLRTKKQEIVIVPDQKYLMVVCQDIARSG